MRFSEEDENSSQSRCSTRLSYAPTDEMEGAVRSRGLLARTCHSRKGSAIVALCLIRLPDRLTVPGDSRYCHTRQIWPPPFNAFIGPANWRAFIPNTSPLGERK